MFLGERLPKLGLRGGVHGHRGGMRGHRPLMSDLAFVEKHRESLLLGARLLELGSRAVQQLPSLPLLEEQRELAFVRERLLKLCPFGGVRGQHALVTDLAIPEQGREPLLLGEGLLELGSHAVQQLLCLSLFEEQGRLVSFSQSLPNLDAFGLGDRGSDRGLEIDWALGDNVLVHRRFGKFSLQLFLQVVELAGDLALP